MEININCDLGESSKLHSTENDPLLLEIVNSASIACGYHAGDEQTMGRTIEFSKKNNVSIGAHPSFNDPENFGRKRLNLSESEIKKLIIDQINILSNIADYKKIKVTHVKPHGAMYNKAVADEQLARAICQAVFNVDPDMIIVALAGSKWIGIAQEMGLLVAREAFADRAVRSDGTLVPRSEPGSVIHDVNMVVERSVKMITQNKVIAITGEELTIHADSICLHGDTPGALEMAKAVKSGLENAGVEIKTMTDVVSR